MLHEGLDTGRAAEHRFQIWKDRKGIEIGMHEGEEFDIRQVSGFRPNADLQIGKLFPERVAPCLGVADMLVEIYDEQRHSRLLSCSFACCRSTSVTCCRSTAARRCHDPQAYPGWLR